MEIDIKEKILRDFGTAAIDAINLLEIFESQFELSPRISRCIVHLAQGDMFLLKKKISSAEEDWRDIIVEAESVTFEFNQPFKN